MNNEFEYMYVFASNIEFNIGKIKNLKIFRITNVASVESLMIMTLSKYFAWICSIAGSYVRNAFSVVIRDNLP